MMVWKLSELPAYWKANGEKVLTSMLDGTYTMGLIKQSEIVNYKGKHRTISLMNSSDRLIYRATFQILNSVIDSKLSEHSYAYREKKGVLEAVKQAANYIEIASLSNIRANLKYYQRRKESSKFQTNVDKMSEYIRQINEATNISNLMLIEAQARQNYYQCFNFIIENPDFKFEKRTRRPPRDAINALISFGNTLLYQRIANEINRTGLDIRIFEFDRKSPGDFEVQGVAFKFFLLSPKAMEYAGSKFLNSFVTPREQASDSDITRHSISVWV